MENIRDQDANLEKNKELARRLVAIYESGDVNALKSIVDPSFVDNNPDPNIPGEGIQQFRNQVELYSKSTSNMKIRINQLYAIDDRVICHFTVSGKNTGTMGDIPATNKNFKSEGVDIYRIANGKIAEHWGVFDYLGMMTQLGLVPEPHHEEGGKW